MFSVYKTAKQAAWQDKRSYLLTLVIMLGISFCSSSLSFLPKNLKKTFASEKPLAFLYLPPPLECNSQQKHPTSHAINDNSGPGTFYGMQNKTGLPDVDVIQNETGLSFVDPLQNRIGLPGVAEPQNKTELQAFDDIENRFGLQVLQDSHEVHNFVLSMDGEQEVVLRSTGTLSSDWTKLQSLEKKMEMKLADLYGVNLGHDGELAIISSSIAAPAVTLNLRSANLAELYALKGALERSVPSQFSRLAQGSCVKVYFLVDRYSGALADWAYDSDRKPAIVVEPYPAPVCRYTVLQKALIHELAHNSAHRLGFDTENAVGWRLVKPLGWRITFNPSLGREGFAIVTRAGNLYRHLSNGFWIRCNAAGQALKADGKPAAPHLWQAQRLSTNEIRDLALVKPISMYFPDPMEMYAEGMTYFREGEQYRRYLLQESPSLYQLVKQQDQLELDKTYGKGEFIRNTDGHLVTNFVDAQKQILEFETKSDVLSARY